MNKIIMDAYGWIEYFYGSSNGEIVRGILNDHNNQIFTHSVTLAETISNVKRKGFDAEVAYNLIQQHSLIINTQEDFSKEVGLLHAEMRKKISDFGLADTFVLLFSQKEQATIVTGDPHFKDIKNVIFLK